MQTSSVQQRSAVPFPAFSGERIYMQPFTQRDGLPRAMAHWQPTVDAMLAGIDAPGPVYLMVDQSPVVAGQPQRRPGVHVDGYWHAGSGSHAPYPPGHVFNVGRHSPLPPGHVFQGGWDTKPYWGHAGVAPEAILLASDVLGCAAYVGDYDCTLGEGGDCSHLDVSGLERVELAPGYAWAGHALTMLHESIPLARDAQRTLVRLNVPGWAP